MSGTMVWQRPDIGDACQSGKIATLLISICFVFNISLLPNYRVKYYECDAVQCMRVACNWCPSLDTALVLGLNNTSVIIG